MRFSLSSVFVVIFLIIAGAAIAGPFEAGQAAYQRRDYATALQLFRPLADQSNAKAEASLGVMYAIGQGVPKDYAEAMTWFRKAADQGNSDGQRDVGLMYERGDGVPQDYAEAMTWFRKAADQGNPDGQVEVGRMYDQGHGVPQDYAEAMTWFRKAADQGNPDAQTFLGIMYMQGQSKWHDYGGFSALDLGQRAPQDYAEAVKWFRRAADQGNSDAQALLGSMYEGGQGVPQDYTAAMMWYRKAAAQDNAFAQGYIGRMYWDGREGVPRDKVLAYMWFNLAAAKGSEPLLEYRDSLAKEMNTAEIVEAQRMMRVWKPTEPGGSPAFSAQDKKDRPTNEGGFVVSQ